MIKVPKNLPNSLLFAGDAEEEARKFAEEIAGRSDIHHYYPEGKVGMHSIASMRKFSQEVYLAPFNGDRKVFIIFEADRMLSTSANALLKTFEEPAKDSVIILVTNHPEKLLPTIRSRCTKVSFPSKPQQMDSPIREDVLNIMRHGKFASYQELKKTVDALSTKIMELQESEKSVIREQMVANYHDDLTASQKEGIEKELEGLMATKFNTHTETVFFTILSWYRDLELLKAGGNADLLMNPQETLQDRGEIQSIEEIEALVNAAKLSLQRFTPLNMVLERVFIDFLE